MEKEDIKEIFKRNKELEQYLDIYVKTEYNSSKNTRSSYYYDLIIVFPI